MGRSKKSKKIKKTMGEFSSLNKAARNRQDRLHAGYGDAFNPNKKTKAKRASVEVAEEPQAPKSIAKVAKAIARAKEQMHKGKHARALGFLVEALSLIEVENADLQALLPNILSLAPQHNLSNNHVKALVKGHGWHKIPVLRLVAAHLLNLSGRSHIVEQFVEGRTDWTREEVPLIPALKGAAKVTEPFEVAPWGALAHVLSAVKAPELDRQFTSKLASCRPARLGLNPEERRILLLEATRRALAAPLWIRLPSLIWVHEELDNADLLRDELTATIKEQIVFLSEIDPQEAISIIFLCTVTKDSEWHSELTLRKALCWDAAGYGFGAVPAYAELAEIIGESDPDAQLRHLRRARKLTETLNDFERGQDMLRRIVALPGATNQERHDLAAGVGQNPSSAGYSEDQRVKKLEARVDEYSEKVTEKVDLAGALIERSKARKSVSDLLRALETVASALEQDPNEITTYNLIEKNFDLDDPGTSNSHQHFLEALTQAATQSSCAAALRATIAKKRDHDKDEALTWLQKALGSAVQIEHFKAILRAAQLCDQDSIANDCLVKISATLEGTELAEARLAFVSYKIRADFEYLGEQDELFEEIEAELGPKAYEGLAAAYLDRLGPGGSRQAREMFDKAHELDPDNERLALDYLMASARPATAIELYDEVVEKIAGKFSSLQRIALLMRQTVYMSNHLSKEQREEMALNVRRELMSQHFRIYSELARIESEKKAEAEKAEAVESQEAEVVTAEETDDE
jgi:hypothetical protein